MHLSLNADAALRAYLLPESWNGEAQHRFVFRTDAGDEVALLAPLAAVEPDVSKERFHYCVVLRPEDAEASRVFIAENLWYRSGRTEINSWMTPQSARRFNWRLFEQSFNDNSYGRRLSRFWSKKALERDVVLQIEPGGWGKILGNDGAPPYAERFIWKKDHRTPHDQQDFRFLAQSNTNFRRQIHAHWNKSDGQIQATLKWQTLDESQRDALAFHCQWGTWNELQDIAALALTVRLGREKCLPSKRCLWDFTAYGEITVLGASLENDDFLFEWRSAITQVFQPDNVDEAGKMIDTRPLCIWSYIGESDLRLVCIEPPSQHEVMEASLRLQEWARNNLTTDEAQRLLAL